MDGSEFERSLHAIGSAEPGLFVRLLIEDGGQDVVEYAALAGFFGIVGWLAMNNIRLALKSTYEGWLNPTTGVPSAWEPGTPLGSGQ
jgi:hypothetical protein